MNTKSSTKSLKNLFKSKHDLLKKAKTILVDLIPLYLKHISDSNQIASSSSFKEYNIFDVSIGGIVAEEDFPDASCNALYRSLLDKLLSPFSFLIVLEKIFLELQFVKTGQRGYEILSNHYESVLKDLENLSFFLISNEMRSQELLKRSHSDSNVSSVPEQTKLRKKKGPVLPEETHLSAKLNDHFNETVVFIGIRLMLIKVFSSLSSTSSFHLEGLYVLLGRAYKSLQSNPADLILNPALASSMLEIEMV